jgi:trans-2,3-dihydro-3-hydroxyanthranilate isomerase
MSNYRFFICDVFSSDRFGGNQLAVLPEADGLDGDQMQQIAREFNFSESTFVFSSGEKLSRRVRIFTPTIEVPFAGHPNIGTAFTLANDGAFGEIEDGIAVTFEEKAGPVPVTINRDDAGRIKCELEAPQQLTLGDTVETSRMADVLSVGVGDIATSVHQPRVGSVGLPFLIVELTSRDALQRAQIDIGSLRSLRDDNIVPDVHLYVRSDDEFDIRARMFAPFDGVPEDPATGSANCALVALLTHYDEKYASGGQWRIAQGVEMGRPSVLDARTERDGDTIRTWIGGHSVLVADGHIDLS